MTAAGPRGVRRLARRFALLVLVVCLGPATACSSGGDGQVAPEAWASTVCGAVASWQADLAAGASDLGQRTGTTAEPAALRDALVGFLAAVTARTDRLAGEVDGAGTPTGEGGEVVGGEVQVRVEDIRRLFDTARADAEGLPAGDAAALARGAANLERTVREGSEAVAAPLGGPADSPARDALRREPACAGLAG